MKRICLLLDLKTPQSPPIISNPNTNCNNSCYKNEGIFLPFYFFIRIRMLTKRLFFKTLSPSQERILLSLARYKFLTAGQMLRMGIMTDRANLNKQISELRYWKNPLVGSVTF